MRFPSSALLVTTVVVFVGTLAAAPVPKAVKKKFPDYYPLAAGSEWLYLMGQTEVTIRVTEFEERDGVKTAKLVTLHGGKEAASEVIRVDAGGVSRTHINSAKVDPPITILKSGLADEEKW